MSDNYEQIRREYDALTAEICITSHKWWARLYFRLFRHWPRKVVDERLLVLEMMDHRRTVRQIHEGDEP